MAQPISIALRQINKVLAPLGFGRHVQSFIGQRNDVALLGRIKPISAVLAESAADHQGTALKKTLGVWGLTALGIGAIIGAGIFVVTGTVARASNEDITLFESLGIDQLSQVSSHAFGVANFFQHAVAIDEQGLRVTGPAPKAPATKSSTRGSRGSAEPASLSHKALPGKAKGR